MGVPKKVNPITLPVGQLAARFSFSVITLFGPISWLSQRVVLEHVYQLQLQGECCRFLVAAFVCFYFWSGPEEPQKFKSYRRLRPEFFFKKINWDLIAFADLKINAKIVLLCKGTLLRVDPINNTPNSHSQVSGRCCWNLNNILDGRSLGNKKKKNNFQFMCELKKQKRNFAAVFKAHG